MTQVDEIRAPSNDCARSELFGDLHPGDAAENVGEANNCESEDRSPQQGAEEPSDEVTGMDRGWAWVVLVATLLVKLLTMAFPPCLGIFYTDLQNEFNASNSEVSWVPALMRALRHAGGPVCTLLMERLGDRATVMLGGVLSGLGLVAGSFTQSIKQLYITAGVITGLGLCFSYQPSVTIIRHYFVRQLTFANAVSSMGMALGMLTLPLLANYLHREFGWRGSCLILGSVMLNCCVCGAVMRPRGPPTGLRKSLLNGQTPQPEEDRSTGRWTSWRYVVSSVSKFMAFDQLVQNSRYRVYVCGVTWMILGYGVPVIYVVPYATAHGMEPSRAALVLTCLGLVNTLTRPLFGIICDKSWIKGRHIYVFSWALLLNGLSNLVCCIGPDFPVLLAYAALQGVTMSAVGSLTITILMALVKMSRLNSAMGLFNMSMSVPLLAGPPLAGVLIDMTGQYFYVFVASSAVISSAAVFLMVAFYWLDTRPSVDLAPASSD